MTFLTPSLLFPFLALALLPLVIHMVNRMRYKSMPWAAMYFLTKAKKSSTKWARLKEYVILALRVFALMLFALALGRPLVGAWLSWAAQGEAQTIIILLDRSASMQTVDKGAQSNRLDRSRTRLIETAKVTAPNAKYLVMDTTRGREKHLSSIELLKDDGIFGATDSQDDMPKLVNQAFEYVKSHDCGQTEFWLVSDMSSWDRDDRAWKSLKLRLQNKTPNISLRVLNVGWDKPSENASVHINESEIKDDYLKLHLRLNTAGVVGESLPLSFSVGDHREVRNIEITSEQMYLSEVFDLKGMDDELIYGSVSLSKDANVADNTAYFALPRVGHSKTLVVANSVDSGKYHAWMTDPYGDTELSVVSKKQFNKENLQDCSLVLLCDGFFDSQEMNEALLHFISKGGLVVAYPSQAPSTIEVAGVSWGSLIHRRGSSPMRVKNWKSDYGPLVRSSSGNHLSLNKLRVIQNKEISVSDDTKALVTLLDDNALLVQKDIATGSLFIWGTRMEKAWSSLNEATILLPFYNRLLKLGQRNQKKIHSAVPSRESNGRKYEIVSGQAREDDMQSLSSGIYRVDDSIHVLNTPLRESELEGLSSNEQSAFEAEYGLRVFGDSENDSENTYTELWKSFLYIMLTLLVIEALLTLRQGQSLQREVLK